MRSRFFHFVGLAAALGIAGCQLSTDQELVGAWTTNRQATKIPDFVAPQINRRVKRSVYSAQLKLSADHTFVLSGLAQGNISGAWALQGLKLSLNPTGVAEDQWLQSLAKIKTSMVDKNLTRMTINVDTIQGPLVLVLDKTA